MNTWKVNSQFVFEIEDSRFKYIYSSKLHDFNMDWYTGIGYQQLSNFIHVSFL